MKQKKLTPSIFRRLIQSAFALYCLAIGWQFYTFLEWTAGNAPHAARPASVEGFLPISALMSFKRLIVTGQWDSVHPAGLAIFIAVLLMAWIFRKGFCGYVCPVGFLSSMLNSLGRKLKLSRVPGPWINLPLSSLKYILLAFFVYTTFITMPAAAIDRFLHSSYNMTADARMLAFFTNPTMLSIVVIIGLVFLGVLIRSFWCRYLCPYGALLGIISLLSPLGIHRNQTTCVNCGKCSKTCPGGIRVDQKKAINSPECIGCTACIGVCPVDDCLTLRAGKKRTPFWVIGLGSVAILLAVYAIASFTGHWDNGLPDQMARMLYGRM